MFLLGLAVVTKSAVGSAGVIEPFSHLFIINELFIFGGNTTI
jgi:hypothetical protein